jgi:hypothetical protein
MANLEAEKSDFNHREMQKDESPSPIPQDRLEYDPHAEKKLIRKIDWRLLPILGALYSIALIDRVNISAARIAGMELDLRLDLGSRYTVALVVFFPPYFLLELPSNIALRKVGSANWLAGIAFAWGMTRIRADFCAFLIVDRNGDAGTRVRQVLSSACCLSYASGSFRSWLLPRLCLFDHVLVSVLFQSNGASTKTRGGLKLTFSQVRTI